MISNKGDELGGAPTRLYSRCNSRRINSPIASVGGTPSNITLCAVSVIGISTSS